MRTPWKRDRGLAVAIPTALGGSALLGWVLLLGGQAEPGSTPARRVAAEGAVEVRGAEAKRRTGRPSEGGPAGAHGSSGLPGGARGAPGGVATELARRTGGSYEELPPVEGARLVAGFLAGSDRAAEVMAITAAIADDAEMRALIGREAEALRRADDPAARARGVLIEVGLGALGASGWAAALAAEPDAAGRALLAATPPSFDDPRDRALVGAALLTTAERDPAGAVRAAALRALPADVEAAGVDRVVALLGADPDEAVRVTAASWLRGAGRSEPAVVSGLYAAATGPSEPSPSVRRASAMALFRLEEASPGALAAAGGSLDSVHAALALEDRG